MTCSTRLNAICVDVKKPCKPVDKASPFVLPVGGTVHDGQQVQATHVLTDKNVVELHS